MRKSKHVRNQTGGRHAKARSARAHSERNGRPRGAFARLMPGRPKAWHMLALTCLTVGVYLIVTSGSVPLGVKLGEPAPRDFVARISSQCIDTERTQIAKDLARQQAPLVFNATKEDFDKSKDALLSVIWEGKESPDWVHIDAAAREKLVTLLPVLEQQRQAIKEALERMGGLDVARLPEGDQSAWEGTKKLVIYGAPDTPERTVLPEQVVLLSADSPSFWQVLEGPLKETPTDKRGAMLSAFAEVLKPTIAIDAARTYQRAKEAAEAEPPLMKPILQGTPILQRGEKVREQHIVELEAERNDYWQSSVGRWVRYQRLVGLAVILLAVVALGSAYGAKYRPELIRNKLQSLSFVVLTLALVGIARTFVILGIPLLLVPLPLVTMILCLVFNQRFGFETAALYGLLVAMAQGTPDLTFAALMLGAMTAALLTAQVRTRSTLIKAGLLVGCVQWAAAWGLGLLTSTTGPREAQPFWEPMFSVDSLCALGNGIMSGFLVSGLLPAIERLFGVTTDIRLLEWSDPNQPLLQRLLLEAPGTYHHSMVVGSLAAEAAEAVGANPLLARVSAYFHDIGKLKKPEYFGENLPENGENPHEDLSPTMSSLIIAAHPRDGAELAEHYALPKEVRDIVLQSHGSTVIRYFWDRAKKRGSEGGEPQESIFRYRAPKPASKEAACVMLCDAMESAARSLESLSSARISSLVHEIILDRLHDGQLSESGLTITDLNRIEETLVRGLNAAFHNRVRYPSQEDEQPARKEPEKASYRSGKPTG